MVSFVKRRSSTSNSLEARDSIRKTTQPATPVERGKPFVWTASDRPRQSQAEQGCRHEDSFGLQRANPDVGQLLPFLVSPQTLHAQRTRRGSGGREGFSGEVTRPPPTPRWVKSKQGGSTVQDYQHQDWRKFILLNCKGTGLVVKGNF